MSVLEVKSPSSDPASAPQGHWQSRWRAIWDSPPWVGWAAAVAAVVLFAQFAGEMTPRGPVTSGQALTSMVVALAVGAFAGLATGSRWTMLVGPLLFTVVFELKRLDLVGPTVDMIDFGSFYGIVAFVLGRVIPAVLLLGPMMIGARLGVGLAARFGHGSARGIGRGARVWVILAIASFVILGIIIARPATTAQIMGADGGPPAGSIAELSTVPIGGHDQALMIRGRDIDNPVLLYLAGGPGGTDIGAIRSDVSLEQHFTVVVWEQRGAGKSYAALDPTDTFTLDRMVADTIEVTDYLMRRFDEQRIFLVGQSWGSTLGILAAQARPDMYHAFVGVGQMVSQRETDIMFWEDSLAWAEDTGNTGLAETLRHNGLPPYDDLNRYAPVVSYEHDWNRYPELDLSNEMPAILFVPEYTFMDRLNAFRGFLDTNGTLYPRLQDIDFRRDVATLEVPYYMIQGEHEARGRAVLADEWFDMVDAPVKERIVFDGAGHRAHFDRPAEFTEVMISVLSQSGR